MGIESSFRLSVSARGLGSRPLLRYSQRTVQCAWAGLHEEAGSLCMAYAVRHLPVPDFDISISTISCWADLH